ncbi:MAG: HAD-IIA family hydrolase [Chloroflexota bacterium]
MLDLKRFRAVLFDMDGVLYRGNELLPGVNELLTYCDEQNIVYGCVTNNSTLTSEQYEAKLANLGVHIKATHIVTSSVATRSYLAEQVPRNTEMYYIGMKGLQKALFEDGYYIYTEDNPTYVVVGADFELTYAKLRTACLAIRAGAHFIGTNPDTTFPSEAGIIPGAGSILALLRAATDIDPFVIGKPAPTMFQTASTILNTPPSNTLVIGDRLDTDIAGAYAAQMSSALVLTGVTSEELLTGSDIQPNEVFPDLPALLERWKSSV